MSGETVWHQASITSDLALALVRRAIETAAANGWRVCAVVVDATGTPLALQRMDGVPAPIVEFATDKAFTAATMRRSTLEYAQRMGSSPSLALGLGTRTRLLTWEGGLPIAWNGEIIGGIGVSGAAGDEDALCAAEALKLIAGEAAAMSA